MKKSLLYVFSLAAVFGCQKGIEDSTVQTGMPSGYVATTEGQTRTSLDEDLNVLWRKDDLLSIFDHSTLNEKYKVDDGCDGKSSATLNRISSGSYVAGTELSANVAYYPYAEVNRVTQSGDGYLLSVTLPTTQTYAADSFGPEASPMVAVTEDKSDKSLSFKNVCGMLKLQLTGLDKIHRIELRGNDGETLAGVATVSARFSEYPTVSLNASEKVLTLDCGESGVQLDGNEPTAFCLVLPPMAFENGFDATAYDMKGGSMKLYTAKRQEIVRSQITVMPPMHFASEFSARDLSEKGTANCYIVSDAGSYKFRTVRGNGTAPVGAVVRADVLWESFGTAEKPNVGELVTNVAYRSDYISFDATGRKGNAVLAARDAAGNILWSWHIWMTDEPQEQVYNNNAGTMMDRNLGATSATKGEVQALGLMYQWGRKDPFLSGSDIAAENSNASSTIDWPSTVGSSASTGTIEYSITHPTTFITKNSNNKDWWYSSNRATDNTRWGANKTIYDPCPAGWRVPDGGDYGVWAKAFGTDYFDTSSGWDSKGNGFDFSKTSPNLSSTGPVWYPAGASDNGSFKGNYRTGYYWSVTPADISAHCLFFVGSANNTGNVQPVSDNREVSHFVRCLKE